MQAKESLRSLSYVDLGSDFPQQCSEVGKNTHHRETLCMDEEVSKANLRS